MSWKTEYLKLNFWINIDKTSLNCWERNVKKCIPMTTRLMKIMWYAEKLNNSSLMNLRLRLFSPTISRWFRGRKSRIRLSSAQTAFPGRHFLLFPCQKAKPFCLRSKHANGSFTYKGTIPLSQPYKWWELPRVVLLVLVACFTQRRENNTPVVSKQADTTVIFISTLVQVTLLQARWFQGLSR